MSKKSNQKLHPGLDMIRKELNAIISKGYNGSRVFQDWIGVMFYAFLHDDPHYLEIMGQYRNEGPTEQREANHFAKATAHLLEYMQSTNEEVLRVLFEEYASDTHQRQYLTPSSIAQLMAQICQSSLPQTGYIKVMDPSCGAGVCLIATAKNQTQEQLNQTLFIGQDINLDCVRMAALNLMFFNLNGIILWGNTLTLEVKGAWETRRSLFWGGSLHILDTEKAKIWLEKHFTDISHIPTTEKS